VHPIVGNSGAALPGAHRAKERVRHSAQVALTLMAAALPLAASARSPGGEALALNGNTAGVPACASCHGAEGRAGMADNAVIPRLAGLSPAYIAKQLEDYGHGRRLSAVMQPVAKMLGPDEMAEVADYYGTRQAPAPPAAAADVALRAEGERLATLGKWEANIPPCMSCHGPKGVGVAPSFPYLAGQSAAYIEGQLEEWRRARRQNDSFDLMKTIVRGLDGEEIVAVASYFQSLAPPARQGSTMMSQRRAAPKYRSAPSALGLAMLGAAAGAGTAGLTARETRPSFPAPSELPMGAFGDMVRLGEKVFVATPEYAGDYVGNGLTCANCHLDRGRLGNAGPMWGAFGIYPQYRQKTRKVDTLEDRVQDCFLYSMNGRRPDPDSPQIIGVLSYIYWLSTGAPVGKRLDGQGYPALPRPALEPSIERGERIFAADCALCHGEDGHGRKVGERYVFPPLWGADSYTWGAGMDRIPLAAAFVKANMPLGGSIRLSDQEAWDVAAFVNAHPRPQDPRFTGSIEETRRRFHNDDDYYGRSLRGVVAGASDGGDGAAGADTSARR
jgi:thiosulfate dehydrogenase